MPSANADGPTLWRGGFRTVSVCDGRVTASAHPGDRQPVPPSGAAQPILADVPRLAASLAGGTNASLPRCRCSLPDGRRPVHGHDTDNVVQPVEIVVVGGVER